MNSPALNEWSIEGGTLALFAEWLGSYFDGSSHTVGNVAQVFPQAELRFQQSSLSQPLSGSGSVGTPTTVSPGLGISVVWVKPTNTRLCWEWVQPPTLAPNPAPAMSRQQIAYADGALMFFVRAQSPQTGTGNSQKVAMTAADLLSGLLKNSSATNGLAQKGIHKVRAESSVLVSAGAGSVDYDLNYSTRMVAARMRLRYAVISQPLG